MLEDLNGEDLHNAEMEDCNYILDNLLDIERKHGLGCEVIWSMCHDLKVTPTRLRIAFECGCKEWDC